eukprot:TRINITY_DN1836_c0_g1_i1.p1 TRINITY_DN1836_c0_g1~~TRINITY_DN1836_c0_g1_i1.p1  ORF type:complete len:398 (-),score=92.12 TRINITY_DN1836_c0_g1_i1:23-1216(-)
MKNIGKPVTVVNGSTEVKGTLVEFNENFLFLSCEDGVRVVNLVNATNITFEEGDERGVQSSCIKLTSSEPLENLLKIKYSTAFMKWSVNYVINILDEENAMFSSWLKIDNQTEAEFPNALLNLIQKQGEESKSTYSTSKVSFKKRKTVNKTKRKKNSGSSSSMRVFEKQNVGIPKGITTLSYVPPTDIPAGYINLCDFTQDFTYPEDLVLTQSEPVSFGSKGITRYFRFENSERHNLGVPFPDGPLLIMNDGQASYVETRLENVPVEEEHLIYSTTIGGVKVTRTAPKFMCSPDDREMEEILVFTVERERPDDKDFLLEIRCPIYRTNTWNVSKFKGATDILQKEDHISLIIKVSGEETKASCGIHYVWTEEQEVEIMRPSSSHGSKTERKKFMGIF